MYGYVYKITNKVNGKPYIGQTTRTVEKRFNEHLKACTAKTTQHLPLYRAINHYGKDNFEVITLAEAFSKEDLDTKEAYWISYYNATVTGYNVLPGGQPINPMHLDAFKRLHDEKMGTAEVRAKISKSMSDYRKINGFSAEHKQKIKAARNKRKQERAEQGLNFYDHPENMASRSIKVYCLLATGERFEFNSILDAGKWWYNNYKPFGEIYSTATYQRKIEDSIAGKEVKYALKNRKDYIKITNIKWYTA